MRIEGHHHRRGAVFAGAALHPLENLAVAAMHAVEVAEREHGMIPARRSCVLRKMDDVHQTVNTRPS
jgi:hypothetical protein